MRQGQQLSAGSSGPQQPCLSGMPRWEDGPPDTGHPRRCRRRHPGRRGHTDTFQMRPPGCGDVFRKRVCCILNIPVGFPQFQDKPILHVALRTSGARTASNPKPHRGSHPAPGVPGPLLSGQQHQGPQGLRARDLLPDGGGAISSGPAAEVTAPGRPGLSTHGTHPLARTLPSSSVPLPAPCPVTLSPQTFSKTADPTATFSQHMLCLFTRLTVTCSPLTS